jgi:hypothetical protein
MSDDNHNNIRDEQFWFTATAIGLNGFILSSNIESISKCFILAASTCVTLYAVFLIILRSAKHADKIVYKSGMKASEKDKGWKDKMNETIAHLKAVWHHIPYVVFEFSGSFFFVMIVLLSWIAVLLRLFGNCCERFFC